MPLWYMRWRKTSSFSSVGRSRKRWKDGVLATKAAAVVEENIVRVAVEGVEQLYEGGTIGLWEGLVFLWRRVGV
jgi:hypothetical protein